QTGGMLSGKTRKRGTRQLPASFRRRTPCMAGLAHLRVRVRQANDLNGSRPPLSTQVGPDFVHCHGPRLYPFRRKPELDTKPPVLMIPPSHQTVCFESSTPADRALARDHWRERRRGKESP